MSATTALPPHAYLADLVMAKIKTHTVGVFAELRVADFLASGPRQLADLAAEIGAHAPSLDRLLRVLAALGLLTNVQPGVYALTPAGHLLRSDAPGSLRGIAAMFGGELHTRAWSRLNHSVLTGEPAFDLVLGAPIFDYLGAHPEAAAMFDAAMTSISGHQARAVVDAYDFSEISTLVDVGGGHGALLAAILNQHSTVRGVLFDLPHVIAGAGSPLDAAGVRDRVEFASGDFLHGVTTGADAYIMKLIIHDWDDERATKILSNCRRAMAPGGRVLIADAVVDDAPESLYAKMLDIEMLVLTPHGKERTADEFERLIAGAGLRLHQIVPTASSLKIVEARPI